MQPTLRIAAAEVLGTAVLMIIGPGSAIIASDKIGNFGVAFAFGLALLAMAYTIGHVSGCHINPAVTLGFLLTRKLDMHPGRVLLGRPVRRRRARRPDHLRDHQQGDAKLDQTGIFAANGWGAKIGSQFGFGSTIVVEIVFTAVLRVRRAVDHHRGLPDGLRRPRRRSDAGMIHLATIPVDNTSVNPARSFGAAIFSGTRCAEAAVGVLRLPARRRRCSACSCGCWCTTIGLEGTMLDSSATRRIRDAGTGLTDRFDHSDHPDPAGPAPQVDG